ncbi:MAG TPA: universal stress protein [bacterium]|nr:universal stress protein [bacterium]HPN42248.1 universal stress protein [bacterium]
MESDENIDNENRNETVFKRAVVAAAFSPRLSAVLNEACRLLTLMGAVPIIIHVGEDTPLVRSKLEEAIACSDFKDYPTEYYIRSGNPADVLINAAREFQVDLIIAGALKKEGLIKYYIGSVARNIARYAPCSVLLMTEPQVRPQPFYKIHCAVEYDQEAEFAVKVAVNISREVNTRDLYFTHTFQEPELAEKKVANGTIQQIKDIYKREDTRLKKFLARFDFRGMVYSTRCLFERSHSVTLDFTREIGADLFIVHGPSNPHSLWERIFPQHLELALQNLPCSILMTR